MPQGEAKKENKYIWYVVAVLCAVLILLGIFLVRDYLHLRRSEIVNARELWITNVLRQHGPPTATEVGFIGSWMTFDYINRLFNIPPDYLKSNLEITDPHYPYLTISSYARHNDLTVGTFLGEIQDAVRNYLATGTGI